MRRLVLIIVEILFCGGVMAAEPTISVTAQQRYPWNGSVDVVFTITGDSGDKYDTSFVAKDVMGGTNLTMKTIFMPDGSKSSLTNVFTSGTYSLIWDTTSDLGSEFRCDRICIEGNVTVVLGGVQLWENGPYWAECNVGATKSEECGYYFWWGDTIGYVREGGTYFYDYYTDVIWISSTGIRTSLNTSPFGSSPTAYKDNTKLLSLGYIDSSGNLVAKYDAATSKLGSPWRMPTSKDIDMLVSNCMTIWTNRNGVTGRLVTGKGAYSTKSIFLPVSGFAGQYTLTSLASGRYLSSTPTSTSDNTNLTDGLYFTRQTFELTWTFDRQSGGVVRAVRDVSQ